MINKNYEELSEECKKGMQALGKVNVPMEVRMIGTSNGIRSGYYEDKDKLLSAIKKYDGVDNIFFTLNSISDDLLARGKDKLLNYAKNTTSDSEIIRRVLLLIDVDPKRPAGVSSTEEELISANEVAESVRVFLTENGFPQPVKACSGNGYHLLYKVDLPNDQDVTLMIKNFLITLDNLFSTDKAEVDKSTFNASRITKLYGTTACKGDNTDTRPHRRSRIVEVPEEFIVVEEHLIKKIVELLPKKEVKFKKETKKSPIDNKLDVKEWVERNNISISHEKQYEDRVCYVLDSCPWDHNHTDKSASVTQFNNGAISAGCHHNSCSEQSWSTLREKYEPKATTEKTEYSENGKGEEKKSQADMILGLALEAGDVLFHDESEETFVAIEKDGNPAVHRINERSYRSFLVKRYFNETKKAPSKDAINQAMGVLEAIAQYEGDEISISKRCAERDGAVYYDLGDKSWTFIKITNEGWEFVNSGQILFIRRKNMKPQVIPEKYNDISIIDKHYRLKSEEDKILHTVSLITKFIRIANPIVVYHGEKGASKTTTMRMDRSIVDPAVRDVISMPKSIADLSLVLHNNYLPCFDNLDNISADKSDILCTASTGGGFSKRKLYSDDEETIYEFKVPVILNGINVVATRADLLDRSLLLELERIPENERKEEREVWEDFEKDKPKMLGAIFSTIAMAMDIYPTVNLDKLGRMADFTRWGYAIAEACGIGGRKFLKAYLDNQHKANDEAVNSNPIAAAMVRLMETRQCFEGTPSKLLEKLNMIAEEENIDIKSRLWAKEPNVLSRRLNELKSNLLMEGITFSTSQKNLGRKIEIRKSPKDLLKGHREIDKSIGNEIKANDDELVNF